MRASSDELERLRGLKQRALDLASSHLEALDVFYLAGDVQPLGSLARGPAMVGGFASVVPAADQQRDGTARASLASTAACVRSFLVCPQVKPGNADFTELVDNIVERHRSGDLSTYGLEHLNIFTLGQLLPAMADMVGSFQEPALDDLIGDAVARLQTEVAHEGVIIAMKSDPDRAEPGVLPHGYLTYWALSVLATCDQHEGEYARPSLRWSETELYRQIALFQTGHDERSDAYQLGYDLLIQYRFNRFSLGDSLVELGLRMLFSAQLERGVWEKRDPIFRWEHGEAYCFSFQLLSSLLRELREDWSLLVPYEEHLARAMEWAGGNALRHHGPPLWRSAHLVEDKMPESWASAEVYTFVQLYASYLSWRIQRIVRHEFRSHLGRDPNPAAFDGLYQPEVRGAGGEPPTSNGWRSTWGGRSSCSPRRDCRSSPPWPRGCSPNCSSSRTRSSSSTRWKPSCTPAPTSESASSRSSSPPACCRNSRSWPTGPRACSSWPPTTSKPSTGPPSGLGTSTSGSRSCRPPTRRSCAWRGSD